MKIILLGILYWVVQLIWGALLTIPGLLITAFCILFLHGKPHKNGFSYIVEVGGNWGGIELGAVALCGGYTTTCKNLTWFELTRRHEFGHTLQHLIFGPLMLFIVAIPSVTRYWYFRLTPNKKHKDYDSIWFEGSATKWGTTAINWIENKNTKIL